MLDNILPAHVAQLCLFSQQESEKGVSDVMGKINAQMGAGVVRFAAMDIGQDWRMNQKMRSPRYTTRWIDLPRVQ